MKSPGAARAAAALAAGIVVASLILFAASQTYGDPRLAGATYVACCGMFLLHYAIGAFMDSRASRRGSASDHDIVTVCALVPLAYAALPGALVAAATLILLVKVFEKPRDTEGDRLSTWRAAAEAGGVGAFLAFQGAVLLSFPISIVLGLNWAARLILWAAALLALVSGARSVMARLVGAAELDRIEYEDR